MATSEKATSSDAAGDGGGRTQIASYYHNRALPRTKLKPSAKEMHWQKQPASAAQLHPTECLQHQALPCRNTPHPQEGAMRRWPDSGYTTGGTNEPLDDRRHSNWFGYRQQRWKRHWADVPTLHDEADVTLTLQDIVEVLTQRFGALLSAFQHLDFFNDGKLSLVEWQQGIYNIFSQLPGEQYAKYRGFCEPRWLFNKRLGQIFKNVDENDDGLISFEELAAPHRQPDESQREFTVRRATEKGAASRSSQSQMMMSRSLPSFGLSNQDAHQDAQHALQSADATVPFSELLTQISKSKAHSEVSSNFPSQHEATMPVDADMLGPALGLPFGATNKSEASRRSVKVPQCSHLLRSFAALLMQRYPSLEKGFQAIDINGNGLLSMAEFEQGAQHALRWAGDTKSIFQELDKERNGTISIEEFKLLRGLPQVEKSELEVMAKTNCMETKRDLVEARKQRSPIEAPGTHARGTCLSLHEMPRPRGEKVTSSAGFWSFERSATGRLDHKLHPNETPGQDQEMYSSSHGPGFCPKGPEYFPETACGKHPLRGDKWKIGSTTNRTERFGPLIPSAQGRQDRELSGAGFANYEGDRPGDTWSVNGSGAHSLSLRRARMGPTHGTCNSAGLQAPKPIGPWQETRASLHLKIKSKPSLLHDVV